VFQAAFVLLIRLVAATIILCIWRLLYSAVKTAVLSCTYHDPQFSVMDVLGDLHKASKYWKTFQWGTVVDHLAYELISGFFALRALRSQPKLTQWSISGSNCAFAISGGGSDCAFSPTLFCFDPLLPLCPSKFRPLWEPLC